MGLELSAVKIHVALLRTLKWQLSLVVTSGAFYGLCCSNMVVATLT
jgi:hypothetical protein